MTITKEERESLVTESINETVARRIADLDEDTVGLDAILYEAMTYGRISCDDGKLLAQYVFALEEKATREAAGALTAEEATALRARAEKAEADLADTARRLQEAAAKGALYWHEAARADTALRERDAAIARAEKAEAALADERDAHAVTWQRKSTIIDRVRGLVAVIDRDGGHAQEADYTLIASIERASSVVSSLLAERATALRERDEARAERDARLAITPEMAAVMILWTDGIDIDPGSATKRVLNDAYTALRAHAERAGKAEADLQKAEACIGTDAARVRS
jgi:chromosome segregation ATPase